MRLIAIATAAVLACASPTVLAADATAAPAANQPAPACNIAFGQKALKVVDPAVSAGTAGVEAAKAGAAFGGEKAKKKVAKAEAQLETAKALQSDLKLIADGKPPAEHGLIAGLKNGSPDQGATKDKLNAVPGIETVTKVLTTPGVADALISLAPIDQVPGVPAGLLK